MTEDFSRPVRRITGFSLSATRSILDKPEHRPNKKLGQNFLLDGNIVRKSIKLSGIGKGSCVVEVGPGPGTLTRAILATGSKLWAVEQDPTLVKYLCKELLPEQPNLKLIEGDCLDYPLAELPEDLAVGDFCIVANLPYAVSTPWLDLVLQGKLPKRMVLMLQKEAADRYVASHGRKAFGAISIFLQSAFREYSRYPVSARCFYPVPKVDSVLLRLDRKKDAVRFCRTARECIRRIFTQRRKQLGTLCRKDPCPEASDWFNELMDSGVRSTIRPEDLPLRYWQRLTARITPP